MEYYKGKFKGVNIEFIRYPKSKIIIINDKARFTNCIPSSDNNFRCNSTLSISDKLICLIWWDQDKDDFSGDTFITRSSFYDFDNNFIGEYIHARSPREDRERKEFLSKHNIYLEDFVDLCNFNSNYGSDKIESLIPKVKIDKNYLQSLYNDLCSKLSCDSIKIEKDSERYYGKDCYEMFVIYGKSYSTYKIVDGEIISGSRSNDKRVDSIVFNEIKHIYAYKELSEYLESMNKYNFSERLMKCFNK